MTSSDENIALLGERLLKAKNDYRQKSSLNNEKVSFFINKLKEDGNIIKALNESLGTKDKSLSSLQATLQTKKNEISKEIENNFTEKMDSLRFQENQLKNKLDHANKELDEIIKSQDNVDPDNLDNSKTLNIKLERLKGKNTELKKLLKESRLKKNELEKIKEQGPINQSDKEDEPSSKEFESRLEETNMNSKANENFNQELIQKKKTMFSKFRSSIETGHKIVTGHYEGDSIIQAIKQYREIICETKSDGAFYINLNEPFIANITKKLSAYSKTYEKKIDRADKDSLEVKLKNQKLEIEAAKTKQDLNNAIQKQKSNSSEFVGGAGFFVSFSDVMSVLLCFFVVFFAIADHDAEKFDEFFSTWPTYGEVIREDVPKPLNASLSDKELELMDTVKKLVEGGVDPESLVRNDTKTIEHIISASDLFSSGSIKVSSLGKKVLRGKFQNELKVGGIKQIIIEGHTDDKELTTFPEALRVYKNNLAFSAARAGAIAESIVNELRFPKKLIIVSGYGLNRPKKPNTSESNRALNRRFIIKILKDHEVEEEITNNEDLPKDEKTPLNSNPMQEKSEVSLEDMSLP